MLTVLTFPGCIYRIDTCYKVYDIFVHKYKEMYTKCLHSVGQLLKWVNTCSFLIHIKLM